MYFSGQGKLYMAIRDSITGAAGAFRFVGNVPELKVNFNVQNLEHKESVSGQRLVDLRITKEKSAEAMFALEDFTADNLSMGLYGSSVSLGAQTVTNEEFPAGLENGNFIRLKYPDVSAVTVKDSAGTPATLTLNTHYRLNAKYGTIEIIDVAAFTQPFKADYTAGTAGKLVKMFDQARPERWLRFEGLNTAADNKPVLVELYRMAFDPLKELALINDDLMKMEMSGMALYDSTKELDAQLGAFGRIIVFD